MPASEPKLTKVASSFLVSIAARIMSELNCTLLVLRRHTPSQFECSRVVYATGFAPQLQVFVPPQSLLVDGVVLTRPHQHLDVSSAGSVADRARLAFRSARSFPIVEAPSAPDRRLSTSR